MIFHLYFKLITNKLYNYDIEGQSTKNLIISKIYNQILPICQLKNHYGISKFHHHPCIT